MTTEELEYCEHWDCPFCHWNRCTGDKDFAVEQGICLKTEEENERERERNEID